MLTDHEADLLAQCVEANVQQATATTNALLANYEARLRDVADAYARLYDGLSIIPAMQRTVYIDRLLARGDHVRYTCDKLLLDEENS